ncbi:acyltransferase family protein [Pararhizobium sp. PWRC1-1]|uniref:acyltransferase family protein n=1 Tax=Pararhizobium sp. PWRC1-1 TaxID=2804566 RepID=UPI003CF248C1
MASSTTTPKFLALESLRGFAALAVVLHHLSYDSFLTNNSFAKHAYLMVDFFFVLSGFVIALNYANRLSSKAEIVTFQRRRFWRLYPLHFFTLMVFLLIECLKYAFEQRTGVISNVPAFSTSDGSAFFANLFLLQGVVLNRTTFNLPSWSISVEFWTYLVFALTIGFFRLRLMTAAALSIGAAAVLLYLEQGMLETQPIFALVRCIYSFFLGSCVAFLFVRGSYRVGSLTALLFLACSVAGVWYLGGTRAEIALPVLFAMTIFVVAGLKQASAARRVLEYPAFVWLGTVSYSIYMTHSIVGWVVTQVLRFGLKLPTVAAENGYVGVQLSREASLGVALLSIVAVLLTSWVTYKYIEDPFRHGWPSRRRLSSRGT